MSFDPSMLPVDIRRQVYEQRLSGLQREAAALYAQAETLKAQRFGSAEAANRAAQIKQMEAQLENAAAAIERSQELLSGLDGARE